jgi:Rrf2 family protein
MRVSSKGDYGLRALFDLALHYGESPVQSADIAKRQDIPEAYLNQLLIILRRAGLIKSVRGPQGGHVLAREPGEIDLAEAIAALEGSSAPVDCVDGSDVDCGMVARCVLRPIWQQVYDATDRILRSTSLADLCRSFRERQEKVMYYI